MLDSVSSGTIREQKGAEHTQGNICMVVCSVSIRCVVTVACLHYDPTAAVLDDTTPLENRRPIIYQHGVGALNAAALSDQAVFRR